MIKKILIVGAIFFTAFGNPNLFAHAQEQKNTEVIVFVREGCSVCHKEEEFLNNNDIIKDNFSVQFLDIGETENKEAWQKVVEKYTLSKVTPITLVGGEVLVGFNERTTGKQIIAHKDDNQEYDLNFYISENLNSSSNNEEYSCSIESASTCSIDGTNTGESTMDLPFFGEINIKETSLFAMSAILGFIDGFNPCAMWVLVMFLLALLTFLIILIPQIQPLAFGYLR